MYRFTYQSHLGYGIKDLEGSDSASLQKEADWWNLTSSMSSSRITQTTSTLKWILGGKNILGLSGGSDLFPYPAFIRTYQNLPPHNFVGISGIFWYFDDMGGNANILGVLLQVNEFTFSSIALRQDTDFTTYEGRIVNQYDLGRDHIKWALSSDASQLTLKAGSSWAATSTLQYFDFQELHIHLSNYSGNAPDLCHISEDKNPLQWQQYPCSLNQEKNSNGNCVSCSTNCDLCFGPA